MSPASTSRRTRPTRIARLSALMALATLFGVVAHVRPAAALGNKNFKNVKVTTTPTTATIVFDSPAKTGVYVIVGTGLDPAKSKVAQVLLPHSPWQHYKTTIGGLKPSTGYSFRLAAPLRAPYTDITLLVTKPPNFRNIFASVQNVTGTIDFDYDGAGPVTITISKTFDFTTHWYRRKILDSPSSAHHWWASFKDMDAGTGYAFQLTAPGASKYVDITSLVTKHRDVQIVYTNFHAIDDGDGWPHGCGDFYLSHQEQGDFDSNYWMLMFAYTCVDSGHSLDLTQSGMAYRTMTDVKTSDFRTDFWAFDDDRKVLDPDCTPDYVSNDCGDYAWGYKYIDISLPGKHTWSLHAYGVQNSLDVTAAGYVVVTYY